MKKYKTWILSKLPSLQVLKAESDNLALVTLSDGDIDNIEKTIDEKKWVKYYPMNFKDLDTITIDHARNCIIIDHDKEAEEPVALFPIEDVKTKDNIDKYFKSHFDDVSYSNVHHSPATALIGPGLIFLAWLVFCYFLFLASFEIRNGERIHGGLKKHLLAGIADLLGPTGIIIMFFIALLPIIFFAYKRYKNPPFESRYKINEETTLTIE